MKKLKLLVVVIVALFGFNSCSKDCGHDFIEVDYSKALVGTWTLVNDDFAEAWVVKEDGSVDVTGVLDGKYYETKGTVKVKNNKMTIKMSANNPAYQDVVAYTFQDQDNTQMHLYMPTDSFEKFFANTSVAVMLGNGQLDINNTEAIAGVYKTVTDAVESINLSIVFKAE